MGYEPGSEKVRFGPHWLSQGSCLLYASQDQDVIGTLESIAEDVITMTGFFHNGPNAPDGLSLQEGIARTNCIDCLDRTNAAQFVISKRALSYQLHTLGVIDDNSMDYDTDIINMFTEM